jgi:hypothetical protein
LQNCKAKEDEDDKENEINVNERESVFGEMRSELVPVEEALRQRVHRGRPGKASDKAKRDFLAEEMVEESLKDVLNT